MRKSTKKKLDEGIEKAVENFDIANMTTKDIKNHPIKPEEVRDAIETYYDMQDLRIRTGNRKSAVSRNNSNENPPLYLQYIESRFKETEEIITKFLKYYVMSDPIGKWLMSIKGIGPVTAAGLLAYIDIKKCETAGSLWAYAGWDGSRKVRTAGQKITWNPKFRTLCWKIGEGFVKVCHREGDVYGHLYLEKKAWYEAKNEAGGFKDKAAEELKHKKYDKNTEAYKCYSSGKLPPAHINAMAKRFAVKIFLSHLFEVWYEYDRGVKAPAPYVKEHKGHVHIMYAPNRELLFPNSTNE